MFAKHRKDITILCAAYKRYKEIHVLINSILCQTLDNWKLAIIHDGPDECMRGIIQNYAENHENINYIETDKRYNDYGHSLRELGITMADTKYLLMTNDDNYYVPKCLEFMFEEIRLHDYDLLLCKMIHNHRNPGIYIQEEYNLFTTHPKTNYIDIGSFIIKTKIAKAVGFRDKGYAGDGTFIDDVMQKYHSKIRVGKVNKVLFVHN